MLTPEGPAPGASRLAAVIVTYEPDAGFTSRLERIAPQVTRLIIVDNSPSAPVRPHLPAGAPATVELIENGRNEGLARGLNQGLRRAAEAGCAWALMLDQDSEVDADIVPALLGVYERCPFRERVALVGANTRSPRSGRLAVRCAPSQGEFVEVKTTITSGSLVALPAYLAAGPLRDDFFIESIDLEYCLRLRRHGFRILLTCRPHMTHAAGAMEERRLVGRTILVANHAPWRYYYATRNLLVTARTYLWREPVWVLSALVNFGKAIVKMFLFEDRRSEKALRIIAGAWDAAIGSRRPRYLP
jgi:rhamnosyltransferase